ncbi:MAG: hypothetical protein IPN55_07785 [Saprospiraceae bacterium]|nr:hypothetical protein [Candidatus Brachybacter algidus]
MTYINAIPLIWISRGRTTVGAGSEVFAHGQAPNCFGAALLRGGVWYSFCWNRKHEY